MDRCGKLYDELLSAAFSRTRSLGMASQSLLGKLCRGAPAARTRTELVSGLRRVLSAPSLVLGANGVRAGSVASFLMHCGCFWAILALLAAPVPNLVRL